MREIDLGLDFIRVATRSRGTRRGLSLSSGTEMSSHLLCFMLLHRTGMRLLFGDADFDQDVENCLALDFQFPGQIVDSNLTHPPFLCPAPLLKSS
jgi:hypothetical protein